MNDSRDIISIQGFDIGDESPCFIIAEVAQAHEGSLGMAHSYRTKGLEKKKPIYRDFRVGDVRHSQANIEKAQTLLDYQPKYMIEKRHR
jgi:hypothetical protein